MKIRHHKLFSMLIALLTPIAAAADSYTSLWKQYTTAQQKDQPQTELRILSRIASKATAERAYGHMLKAQLAICDAMTAISPDSLQTAVDRLKTCEATATASGDNVLAAIYQSVLGKTYSSNPQLAEDGKTLGKKYFAKSMSHPDALADAFSTGYEPFVVDGVDSKYYYDDMLHIIGIAAGDYRGMHAYYDAHGKREGACLTALEMVRGQRKATDVTRVKKSEYILALDSLAREYGDLTVCGEVAIERYAYMENAEDVTPEDKMNYVNYALMKWGAWPRMNILRNAQRRLTLPSFHASLGGQLALPGVPRKVVVMGLNNIGELRLTVSRLDIDGTTKLDPENDKDYARLRRHIVATEQPITDVRRYVGQPAYKTISDTLEIKGLKSGMYLVEMSTDNVSMPVERQLLHVCDIYPVIESQPGNKYRVAVLNATTGVAVPGAKIDVMMRNGDNSDKEDVQTFTCDQNGEATITYTDGHAPQAYRIYTDTETAFPQQYMAGQFHYYNNKATTTETNIYTDRRIYRPGQTVRVAAVAYTYDNSNCRAEALKQKQMTITLRDANHKEVAKHTVTTDDYGMASTDFALPQGGLNGTYTLRSDCGNSTYANFSVEEYKRPTFKVDIDKANTKYAAGDTVRLNATAKTFAGVAVQGARVAVQVVRRPALFWRFGGNEAREETVFTDTVQTANDGSFSVKVPISLPYTYDEHPRRYYSFDVTADVTDASGETRHGEMSLPYSDHPTMLTCDIPEKTLRDSLRTVTFSYINNAGEPVDGDVTYYIDNNRYTCKANTPAKINSETLASARHKLVAYCGTDTLQTSFVTFTLNDRQAPVETHDWFYLSGTQFPADGKPVYIQIGSSDSIQHIVYTLISGDKIIEDGRADLKNEVRMRALTYNEAWGDGITLSVAWVKSGHSYRHTARIERPLPDTHLNIKWTTFRDRLTPGQRETWTLNITRPDGKPARAQLLATLYDKSLDELRPHSIGLRLPTFCNVPWMAWSGVYNRDMFAYSEMPVRFLDESSINFSHFEYYPTLYGLRYGNIECVELSEIRPQYRMMGMSASEDAAPAPTSRANNLKIRGAKNQNLPDGAMAKGGNDTRAESHDGKTGSSTQLRENLNETAFFYPGVTSDDKGNISLKFTLPESVTTWQFYGLAHDQQMNNATIAATTVAKKTVMVQPNMPRFVRSTDCGTLSARIQNTSDKTVSGTARLTLANPETGKEVYRKEIKYTVKANETATADFDFDMAKIDNDGLLVCRITASGHGYSDGEQHYLPVLPSSEMVTNTVAFTQNGPGTKTIDLDRLFAVKDKSNRLTVEYTNSPAWLMIQALPTLATPDGDNAMSLATAYYANAISRSLMHTVPAIKQTVELWGKESDADNGQHLSLTSALQKNAELKLTVLDETPWLADANRETEQKQLLKNYFDESLTGYRLTDNITRLQNLQREDGSFAWWKGMEGSPSMTMAVLQTLVRLNYMVGQQQETSNIIAAAFSYMDKRIDLEVKQMRKLESEGKDKNPRPSETAIEYLYANTLANRKSGAQARQNIEYLTALLAKQNTQLSIYGKAVAAVVLAKGNHRKEAADLIQSIKEYTVYTNEMGRYFDTHKALYSWFDYRIPSQVAAIEAIQALDPNDTQTIAEMQQWLLQSKRTQAWSTPINSVNAVYAFLNGNTNALANGESQPAVLKVNGQKLSAPKATAGLGYVKTAKTGDNLKTFTAEKTATGTSWGAVYAQFMQPTADVADAATGMTVKRELLKNGKPLQADNATLNVGDRITVRITIVASRDYDFVQLTDRRAACLEPTSQLSGYANGYYCQPKDNATSYFFGRLSKGKHVVETTYYADRKGTYHTGTCAVQCAYSPEFSARAKAVTLNVK